MSDTYRSEMIDIPVMSFVSTDHSYNILESGVFRQPPVIYRNGRGRNIFDFTTFDCFQVLGVRDNRFLFQIPNKPMRQFGGGYVNEKESVGVHPLRNENKEPLVPLGLHKLNHRHQMHPLVLGFFE
ncbi:hypothetical protein GQ457_06G002580 [Hibiscus cannabinus]